MYRIGYFSIIIILLLFMIFNIMFNLFIIDFSLLIFFWAVKFLSGFGIMFSIANGFLIFLKKFKDRIEKKHLNVFNIVQIVTPLIIISYAIYLVISSYLSGKIFSQTGVWLILDLLIYFYGIISLLANLYILPIIRDQIEEAAELGKLGWWKKTAKKAARGIKKKYFELRKEYASAQVQDQMTTKEILDLWRKKFALNFLLIIGIGSILFTPITFVCIVFWLRIFIFFRSKIKTYEKISLLVSLIFIGLISLILPFLNIPAYANIEKFYWSAQIFYLIGVIIAAIIFIKKLLELQGITISSQKIKRREKQIEALKKEKLELEEILKEKEDSE
jgi:hypothetical protein